MNKLVNLLFLLLVLVKGTSAQKTAMDFDRNNCSGNKNHLFADLDSGKAVVLFYYMPSCSSCPPPAKKVQTMLNNLDKRFPNKVKAYAMPYNNSTKCVDVNNWVNTNGLTLFTPMDSGATQVGYYGGMGMPSVILVGGTDHRVLFAANQDRSFKTTDTLLMKDSILTLFGIKTGIHSENNVFNNLKVFPNPSSEKVNLSLFISKEDILKIDLMDPLGRTLQTLSNEKVLIGSFEKSFDISQIPSGNYLLRITLGENQKTIKINHTLLEN